MIKETYLFLYYYIKKSIKESGNTTVAASTIMVFSTLQCFNILMILKILQEILGIDFFDMLNPFLIVLLFLVVITINALVTNKKDWIQDVSEKYSELDDNVHKRNWHITLSYMIGSFLMVIVTAFTFS